MLESGYVPVVEKTGGKSNLFIGVLGTQGAVLGSPFQGTVVAPNGLIDLNTVGAPGHSGSFSKTVCHQFLEVLPTTPPELADAIA